MPRTNPWCHPRKCELHPLDDVYRQTQPNIWGRISCFWHYILNHADTAIPELVLSLTSTAIGGWALFNPTDIIDLFFHEQYIDVFLFMAGLAQFSMLWVPRRATRVAALVTALANLGISIIWIMVATFVLLVFPPSVGSIAICGMTIQAGIIFLRTDFKLIRLQ